MGKTIRGLVAAAVCIIAAFVCFTPSVTMAEGESRKWETGQVYDQGIEPSCVGYALRALLDAEPYPMWGGWPTKGQIYWEAHYRWDSIPDDEPYEGTTVEGGVLYLQHLGLLGPTWWSTDTYILTYHILNKGPIVIASPWKAQMNYLYDTGHVVYRPGVYDITLGYHAYMCYGYDSTTATFYCQNSWGDEWGDGGRFLIHERDLRMLMDEWQYSRGAMPVKRVEEWGVTAFGTLTRVA